MATKNHAACPDWNPFQIYTWTLKQVQAWADRYGASAFYSGRLWRMKSVRVCPGRYEVRFEGI